MMRNASGCQLLSRPSAGSGFTLVELLVAVSILALVALLGWRGLEAGIAAQARLSQESREAQAWLAVLRQLEQDVAMLAASRRPDQSAGAVLLPATLRLEREPSAWVLGLSQADGREVRWRMAAGEPLQRQASGGPAAAVPAQADLPITVAEVRLTAWSGESWVPLESSQSGPAQADQTRARALQIELLPADPADPRLARQPIRLVLELPS